MVAKDIGFKRPFNGHRRAPSFADAAGGGSEARLARPR